MSTLPPFVGYIAGVKYTDREEWEKAARDAGFRRNKGRTGDWRVGLPVRFKMLDGEWVDGQVWCKSERNGFVWLALDNGKYAEVPTGAWGPAKATGRDGSAEGRVAA